MRTAINFNRQLNLQPTLPAIQCNVDLHLNQDLNDRNADWFNMSKSGSV